MIEFLVEVVFGTFLEMLFWATGYGLIYASTLGLARGNDNWATAVGIIFWIVAFAVVFWVVLR